MKAITLWRPWDRAILFASKDCENRTRPPPRSVIGRDVALHAGKTYAIGDWTFPGGWTPPPKSACPIGIVGVVRIVGVLDLRDPKHRRVICAGADHDRVARLDRSPWWAGPVGILVEQPRAIEPIEIGGAMGWWDVPEPIAVLVRARLQGAA